MIILQLKLKLKVHFRSIASSSFLTCYPSDQLTKTLKIISNGSLGIVKFISLLFSDSQQSISMYLFKDHFRYWGKILSFSRSKLSPRKQKTILIQISLTSNITGSLWTAPQFKKLSIPIFISSIFQQNMLILSSYHFSTYMGMSNKNSLKIITSYPSSQSSILTAFLSLSSQLFSSIHSSHQLRKTQGPVSKTILPKTVSKQLQLGHSDIFKLILVPTAVDRSPNYSILHSRRTLFLEGLSRLFLPLHFTHNCLQLGNLNVSYSSECFLWRRIPFLLCFISSKSADVMGIVPLPWISNFGLQ